MHVFYLKTNRFASTQLKIQTITVIEINSFFVPTTTAFKIE